MEELIQNAIDSLLAYPEAPFVIGIVGLVFLVSFIFVTRELTSWYFKTSRIENRTQKLETQLEVISQQLEDLSVQISELPVNARPASSEAPLAPPKRDKGFPLSH